MPWIPRRRAVPVLVLATLGLGALVAAPAQAAVAPAPAALVALPAHAQLTGTTPEDGSTVEGATEVVLTFSDPINADFVEVAVEGPDGPEADGDPVVDGRDVTQALSADLPAGLHEVTYRVVSSDGHPVSGTMSFTTAPPPSESPSESATPSSTPEESSSPSATPSPTATPEPLDTEETSDAGPSTGTWVAIGAVALALLATFITLAARGDRSGRDPSA